jgi:hypothetical protein
MDFIVGIPITLGIHDSIFVLVDTLIKSAHFILAKNTYQPLNISRVFITEIVILHGITKKIILDTRSIFIEIFLTICQEVLGTQLNFSTVTIRKPMKKLK